MRRFFAVLLFVPLYYICSFTLIYITLVQNEVQAFEEYKLAISANYAVDAAAEEMLYTTDVGLDYVDKNKISADPQLALDAFIDTFALNYNLPLVTPIQDLIELKYIKMFVVAAYDGFYVFTPQVISEDGEWKLVSTPKLPYTYVEEIDGKTAYYALNMGTEDCLRFLEGKITRVPIPISASAVKASINSRISDELMYRLDTLYQYGTDKVVYIPAEMTTIRSVNPIDGPTVLAFLDDIDLSSSKTLQAFSIGGAKVEPTRMCVAYVREVNGVNVNYYCYEDLLSDEFSDYIVNIYPTPLAAAQAGYYHDPMYMD